MLEGVSLSTAVETPWGPFRRSGAPGCYVLDPRAQKLRHFVTPGYGNPWCYVYNGWGQGIVGDGTTPQQHWDTPLSGAEFPGRKGMNTVFDGEGKLAGKQSLSVTKDGKPVATLTAPHIILATGARARDLPFAKADGKRIWTYRHAMPGRFEAVSFKECRS